MTDILIDASAYLEHGFALCGIEGGQKAPTYKEWTKRSLTIEELSIFPGVGLLHSLSGTCALDVDDIELARPWLAERSVDVDALLAADDAVMISSGRSGRAKLLYKISKPLRTFKPTDSGLELRCATASGTSVQDVLPPSIHPVTKRPYEWKYGLLGHWQFIPPIPAPLLALWRELAEPIGQAEAPPPTEDVERLRKLLSKRDPDAPYDEWLKIGMAIHHEAKGSLTGLAVWNEFSSRGKKYKGEADLRTHWLSFRTEPGKAVVTIGSLESAASANADEFPSGDLSEQPAAIDTPRAKRNLRIGTALGMQKKGNGAIICNTHNAELLLRNMCATGEMALMFDEFMQKKLVAWPGQEVRAWTDIDTITLQVTMQRMCLQTLGLDNARNAAERIAAENTVNCVRDWLEGLKHDGERRLTTWAPRAFGAPYDRYHLRTGRNWLLSMVKRAYEPGCQVDQAVVLEGPQGLKKSSALRAIGEPWYFELTANPDSKDFEQQLRGVWLAEFPELNSIARASVERIKQYITNRVDRYRPSYGREEIEYLRRCVLAGSTNNREWAKDTTGNRRFIPIECTAIDLDWIKANREQLFAEAVAEYKRGRKHWMWPARDTLAKQDARVTADPWEDAILTQWADASELADGKLCVTMGRILSQVLGIPAGQQTSNNVQRATTCLRRLGFVYGSRLRIGGVRVYPWYAPIELAAENDPLLQ